MRRFQNSQLHFFFLQNFGSGARGSVSVGFRGGPQLSPFFWVRVWPEPPPPPKLKACPPPVCGEVRCFVSENRRSAQQAPTCLSVSGHHHPKCARFSTKKHSALSFMWPVGQGRAM